MEPPARFDAHTVRAAKAAVLSAIQTQTPEEALRNSARGQYTAGRRRTPSARLSQGGRCRARQYDRNFRRAAADDRQLALGWRAVLSAHRKSARAKRTEIAIKFRTAPLSMFQTLPVADLADNYLVIGIDPVERISLQFNAKAPGLSVSIRGVQMDFCYRDYFRAEPKTGYETCSTIACAATTFCSSAPTASRLDGAPWSLPAGLAGRGATDCALCGRRRRAGTPKDCWRATGGDGARTADEDARWRIFQRRFRVAEERPRRSCGHRVQRRLAGDLPDRRIDAAPSLRSSRSRALGRTHPMAARALVYRR